MTTVVMNASGVGGTIQLQNTGTVVVPASGLITVDARDSRDLLNMGATYVSAVQRAAVFTAPRLGTAGRFVASTALAAGTLTIANQPDVPRQASVVMGAGTSAVTAGNLALTYVANDGTSTVDNISAVMAASATATNSTSKGVQALTSAIVTGLTGGTSPYIYISDTNSLSFVVDPGFQSFTLVREAVDGVNEPSGYTVASSAASVIPSTAPNGTRSYSMAATYTFPNT